MKKYIILLLSLLTMSSCEDDSEIINVDVNKKPIKVTICHYNKGNDTWKTILVNEKQLQRHIDHGDYLGECVLRTYVPDDTFEQYLIDEGYDDVLDDYVVTSNIQGIEGLNLNYLDIQDLTGIEDFIDLIQLSIVGTKVKTLDLTNNPLVDTFYCNDGALEELKLGLKEHLETLHCQNNNLTELDLSGCPIVWRIKCYGNNISCIQEGSVDILANVANVGGIGVGYLEKDDFTILQDDCGY